MTRVELLSLLESWIVHLKAERKSASTLKSYRLGVEQFVAWSEREDVPAELNRRTVGAFIAALLDEGAEATTAKARQLAVRRFSAWLAEEDEVPEDRLYGMRPPKVDTKVTPSLTDDECRALLAACSGKDFRARRDEAIVRLMLETGARCDEVISQLVDDVNLTKGMAIIRRGKGGKGRPVPFGPVTSRSIDRYIRARRGHRLADSPRMWLGDRGRGFSYDALWKTLKARAEAAGLVDFHPHVLRHSFSARWLDAGGSEGGLMAIAGWSQRAMIDRYTRATSQRRAADEARKLGLGDGL
jgi:integrase/recombinase XerD